MVRLLKLLFATAAAEFSGGDRDVILEPRQSDTSLPERLLIFIPGAAVPTEIYRATAEAIQAAATDIRLTIVVPATFQRLCISQCPSSGTCFLLKRAIDSAVAKSNWKGRNSKEDTFVAGHSMGSVCAKSLVTGYGFDYAGLIAFGGYVDKTGESSIPNIPIPVLHLTGEVDGGGARPGRMSLYYRQFKEFSNGAGEKAALVKKPVLVLPGVDHSDFCPGFFVTAIKDLKSEVSQEEALQSIGMATAAFLHVNSPVSSSTSSQALGTLSKMLSFTKEMCEPYLKAFEMESSGSFCKIAQTIVAGVTKQDASRLQVDVEPVSYDDFSHKAVTYTKAGSNLKVNVVSSFEGASGLAFKDEHGAAKSIDCLMVDATRVAQQLGVQTQTDVQCGELTEIAVAKAMELLPAKSLQRYLAKGRSVVTKKDQTAFGDIGPVFLKGDIGTDETSESLEVSALSLVNDIHSSIFAGVHHCKLISPALVMEFMMTDGLKPFPYDLTSNHTVLV